MERVQSSWRGLLEWGDIGVCREMICDIAKRTVNSVSSAHCHIRKRGYTGCEA